MFVWMGMVGIGRKKDEEEQELNDNDSKKTLREVLGLEKKDKIKSVKLKIKMKG